MTRHESARAEPDVGTYEVGFIWRRWGMQDRIDRVEQTARVRIRGHEVWHLGRGPNRKVAR